MTDADEGEEWTLEEIRSGVADAARDGDHEQLEAMLEAFASVLGELGQAGTTTGSIRMIQLSAGLAAGRADVCVCACGCVQHCTMLLRMATWSVCDC